jgi:hypothetical protein
MAIAKIIDNNDFDWLRKRLPVVTFEECWPYGIDVTYENDKEIVTRHYVKLAQAVKNKDAAGLGSLAYALSKGDSTALLGDSDDIAVRTIASGIGRPGLFWKWIKDQAHDERELTLVTKAEAGFRKSGWPWDRAFAQAAAYLAVSVGVPEVQDARRGRPTEFPLWIGIDKHTAQGKIAIKQAAKSVGIPPNQALWLAFYLESAQCNELSDSRWWQKEISWRYGKLHLTATEAERRWATIRPFVQALLDTETTKLRESLNSLAAVLKHDNATQLQLI